MKLKGKPWQVRAKYEAARNKKQQFPERIQRMQNIYSLGAVASVLQQPLHIISQLGFMVI